MVVANLVWAVNQVQDKILFSVPGIISMTQVLLSLRDKSCFNPVD